MASAILTQSLYEQHLPAAVPSTTSRPERELVARARSKLSLVARRRERSFLSALDRLQTAGELVALEPTDPGRTLRFPDHAWPTPVGQQIRADPGARPPAFPRTEACGALARKRRKPPDIARPTRPSHSGFEAPSLTA